MNKLVGLIMVLFVFQGLTQTQEKKTGIVNIKTSAMCELCKERIEENFNFTKGIVFAELNLEDNIVTVKYKTKHLSVNEVKQILADLGYHADEIERNNEAFNGLPECCKDKNSTCTGK